MAKQSWRARPAALWNPQNNRSYLSSFGDGHSAVILVIPKAHVTRRLFICLLDIE